MLQLKSSFWHKNRLLVWNTHPIPDSAMNCFWLFPKVNYALCCFQSGNKHSTFKFWNV
jgi:hypothetical protein